MCSTINIKPIQKSRGRGINNRENTLQYHLPLSSGEKLVVCKKFYMATLGLKGNGIIAQFLKWSKANPLISPSEKRGGRQNKDVDEERNNCIMNHINSFNPQISHYNRNHAPNPKYLPPELSVKYMWDDYVSNSKKC